MIIDPLFDLTGRVVVITGGLGNLGQRYAVALYTRGARVALLDTDEDPGRLTDPLLKKAYETNDLYLITADVTSKNALSSALDVITERWDVPWGLINNASLDSPPGAPVEQNGPFETFPESVWDEVIAVNLKGLFLTCQVFGGAMAQKGQGSIINVASIYGMVSPDQNLYKYRRLGGEMFYKPVAYSASKSGVYNLTRYLATYWGAKNVRVNSLTLAGVYDEQDEEFLKNYTIKVPVGRMADRDEYNGAVVFLLSDASAYMTGSNMVIDGGFTAL